MNESEPDYIARLRAESKERTKRLKAASGPEQDELLRAILEARKNPSKRGTLPQRGDRNDLR
jgi:hypothetical protein